MSIVLGIDPGFKGGFTFVDSEKNKIIDKCVTPILTLKTKKKTQNEYDLGEIKRIFQSHPVDLAVLEIQQSFPKQGISSTFKTGRGFGLLEGMLFALGIRYSLIKPREWQKELFAGLPNDDTKNLSKMVAQRLFPGEDFRPTDRCKNLSDGLTDSCLMAEYERRRLL